MSCTAGPGGSALVEYAQPAESVTAERDLLAGAVGGFGVAEDLAHLCCTCLRPLIHSICTPSPSSMAKYRCCSSGLTLASPREITSPGAAP